MYLEFYPDGGDTRGSCIYSDASVDYLEINNEIGNKDITLATQGGIW